MALAVTPLAPEAVYFTINPINLTTITKQKRVIVNFPATLIAGQTNTELAALNTDLDAGGWRIFKESAPVATKTGSIVIFTLVKLT